MKNLGFSLALATITISFTACRAEKTEELGKVQDCGNGQHFNLQTGQCTMLAGHKLLFDGMGFERVSLKNGMTVPRVVNGKTPFSISFTYDVSRQTSFDLVLKKVEDGNLLNDNLTDWAKVTVEAGKGTATVRLYPKDRKAIEPAKAANYLEGEWLSDSGYAIELKGGDRYEDDDGDPIKSWRVAGVEVNAEAPDDPEGKIFILGDIVVDEEVRSCGEIKGTIEIIKSEIDLDFYLALKEPAKDWHDWGGVGILIAKGTKGIQPFSFWAKDEKGNCPPPGDKVQLDPWRASAQNYLIQLDIKDDEGEKIELDQQVYKGVRSSVGVRVTAENEE